MTQLQLDLSAGQKRKREGLARVISHEPTFHDVLTAIAIKLSLECGSVTSDDLRIYCNNHGIHPENNRAFTAIFHGKEWQWIGRKASVIESNHGRFIGIFQYHRMNGVDA